MRFKNIFFCCLFLIILSSCQSIDGKKYGFEGSYIYPEAKGLDSECFYILSDEDAAEISFILKESKSNRLPIGILVRVSTSSLGEWFDLDFAELILEDGQKIQIKGSIERRGNPIKVPHKSELGFSGPDWIESAHSSNDKERFKDFNISTGYTSSQLELTEKRITHQPNLYPIKIEKDYTQEILFGYLSDEDLKSIANSKIVTLRFYSHNRLSRENQNILNKYQTKKRILNYYFTHKTLAT